MNCKQCFSEIEKDCKFCPKCGADQVVSETKSPESTIETAKASDNQPSAVVRKKTITVKTKILIGIAFLFFLIVISILSDNKNKESSTPPSPTSQQSQSDSTNAQTPEQNKANAEMIASGLISVVNPANNPYRVKNSSDAVTRTWRCGDTGMSEKFRKFIFDMVSTTAETQGLPKPDYSLCFVGHMTFSMGQMGVQDRAYVEFFPTASDVEADPMHYDYMLVFFKHVNWQITLWAPQKEPFNLCVKQLNDLEMGTCKSSEPLEVSALGTNSAEGGSTAGNHGIDSKPANTQSGSTLEQSPQASTPNKPVQKAELPLFRLVRGNDHFYTTNCSEKDYAVARYGYSYQGVQAYVFSSPSSHIVPLYRLYNSSVHFYTADQNEEQQDLKNGWQLEPTMGYVANTPQPDLVPLYRSRASNGGYLYTTDLNEWNSANANGGIGEGITGWVVQNHDDPCVAN